MTKTLTTLLALLSLSACTRVAVEDNMDRADFGFDLDFSLIPDRENDINGPYAAGTDVGFRIVGENDTEGWSFTSSEPAVLRVVGFDEANGEATLTAESAGTTHIQLLDDRDRCMTEFDVEVRDVAEIRLASNALLKSGEEMAMLDPAQPVHVLRGGAATFRARFFADDGTELRGRDLLRTTSSDASVSMTDLRSFSAWLRLEPTWEGSAPITLSVNGADLLTLEVIAVEEDALTGLEVAGEETSAELDEVLVLRATGEDAAGDVVFGVEPTWATAGGRQLGVGDLYTYRYDPALEHMLEVELAGAGLSANKTVHGTLGYVSSSNDTACSVGYTDNRPVFGTLMLLCLGLAYRRSR